MHSSGRKSSHSQISKIHNKPDSDKHYGENEERTETGGTGSSGLGEGVDSMVRAVDRSGLPANVTVRENCENREGGIGQGRVKRNSKSKAPYPRVDRRRAVEERVERLQRTKW